MYLTVKQQLKHLSKYDYRTLKLLSKTAKNLTNEAIYNIRQHYFHDGTYIRYEENYKLLKNSMNYRTLNSNMSQQILKEVDGSFRSFFGLLKLAKEGKYRYDDISLPRYLPKDGYAALVIGFVRVKDSKLILPYSNMFKKTHSPVEIRIPPVLKDKKIKEIRIIPKLNARFFEIQYTYEKECIQRNLNKNNALAIDLGINNLATAVTNTGHTFIIDGRRLKSINQYYNKENARLQSIKDKQNYGKKTTLRQKRLSLKHNNQVNDYMNKTARIIIDYCIDHDIGKLIIGYNEDFQRNVNLGKPNNQTFTNIPFGKLRDKLKYLCEFNDIEYIPVEESYTSKASFFDYDDIPVYSKEKTSHYIFSGKRIYRGMYETMNGYTFNADVNGALNILKKSKVVRLESLYNRGEVDTPIRIRIA